MSYDMKFSGVLEFDDEDVLAEAISDADEALEGTDSDFREVWLEEECVVIDELTVRISVDISGPGDWWFDAESIIETFADVAETGVVKSWYDGEPNDSYGPDADEED